MALKSRQLTSHNYVGFFVASLLLAGLVWGGDLFFHWQPIINQLHAWHLLYEPETFTELYFEDHLNLPKSLALNKSQSFRFTIHNLEYKTMTYPYEVYLQDGENIIPISTSSATLNQDQYQTISQDFTLPKKFTRVEVVVNLIDLEQSIHFWIPN